MKKWEINSEIEKGTSTEYASVLFSGGDFFLIRTCTRLSSVRVGEENSFKAKMDLQGGKKKTISVLWEHNASLRRILGIQTGVVFIVQIKDEVPT